MHKPGFRFAFVLFICKKCPPPLSIDTNNKPSTSNTLHVNPMTELAKKLSNFLTSRPIISQVFNFLRGFHLHRNYTENCDFTAWKGQNIIYAVKFSLISTIPSLNQFNLTRHGLNYKVDFLQTHIQTLSRTP